MCTKKTGIPVWILTFVSMKHHIKLNVCSVGEKKTPTKRNVGEKSEAYYKVMGIYETKLKQTPGVKNSTRRKKGHYSSDKTEKSMSWEMLISKQAEG